MITLEALCISVEQTHLQMYKTKTPKHEHADFDLRL